MVCSSMKAHATVCLHSLFQWVLQLNHVNVFIIYNDYGMKTALRRVNTATVNLKTGRFHSIDSAVIISSVAKAADDGS